MQLSMKVKKAVSNKGWTLDEFVYLYEYSKGNLSYEELLGNVPTLVGVSPTTINEIVAEINFNINSEDASEYAVGFNKWWDTYPSNDAYLHWFATRSLKIDRSSCLNLYTEAAKKYGVSTLQSALENEITSRRLNSNNSNEFKFMPNTKNYLEKAQYEGFINFTNPMTGDLGAQSRVRIS